MTLKKRYNNEKTQSFFKELVPPQFQFGTFIGCLLEKKQRNKEKELSSYPICKAVRGKKWRFPPLQSPIPPTGHWVTPRSRNCKTQNHTQRRDHCKGEEDWWVISTWNHSNEHRQGIDNRWEIRDVRCTGKREKDIQRAGISRHSERERGRGRRSYKAISR